MKQEISLVQKNGGAVSHKIKKLSLGYRHLTHMFEEIILPEKIGVHFRDT